MRAFRRRSDHRVPASEATPGEQEQRDEEGYTAMESKMGEKLGSALNIPMIDKLSSYLGKSNPLAREVDPKTTAVWLLDNTAYRPVHPYPHRPQPWQAEFVAAYFVRDSGKDWSKIVADIADKIGLGSNKSNSPHIPREEGEKIIAQRFKPFVDDIQPGRYVNVQVHSEEAKQLRLGPADRDAISSDIKVIGGRFRDGDAVSCEPVPAQVGSIYQPTVRFAETEGWMVISDIDDTLKITMTASPVGVLRSTFIDTPTPIAGMPELYQQIQSHFSPCWFYLSASPYNLYPFLRPFLHQYYPGGTVILRDASWMDLAGFLRSYTVNTQQYKASRIDKVNSWLPRRKVICVGDSTQSDPEAYAELYRKKKGWIRKIFIRRVVGISEHDEQSKNNPERFEKAFDGVPRDVWQVFDQPTELYAAVEALRGT